MMFQELFDYEAGREGFFGEFGGAYIPEILHETFAELRQAFDEARRDPSFWPAIPAGPRPSPSART